MAGTPVKGVKADGPRSETRKLRLEHNKVISDLELLRESSFGLILADQVLTVGGGAGLSVDAAPEDVETDNAIKLQVNGLQFARAAVGAIDISTKAAAGATIAISTSGAAVVYLDADTGVEVEVDKDAQDYTSAIIALANLSKPTNTMPPAGGVPAFVPVGVIQVTEGGSGTWTWGTDSITGETETYYDCLGLSGVITEAASFDQAATPDHIDYGAGVCRLGSGVVVSYTGKDNVAFAGSNVVDGDCGAWVLFVLADDSEYLLQLGEAYGSLADAQTAVDAMLRNPVLAHIATLYVENASGADFVPDTTSLTAEGITATYVINSAANTLIDSDELTAATVNA